MKSILSKAKGITLIALVITIVIIMILAGITINLTVGENGIFTKSKQAREEYQKKAATEILNLKITECQIECYSNRNTLPSLAYLIAFLKSDGDIEYVEAQSGKQASIDEETEKLYASWERVFTKLEKYPYEFEIDRELRLASINGIEVGSNNQLGNYVSKSEYESLKSDYNTLLQRVTALENNKADKTELQELETNLSTEASKAGVELDYANKVALSNTLNAANKTYTAPNNGYICAYFIRGENSTSGLIYINIQNNNTTINHIFLQNNNANRERITDHTIVNKGDVLKVEEILGLGNRNI